MPQDTRRPDCGTVAPRGAYEPPGVRLPAAAPSVANAGSSHTQKRLRDVWNSFDPHPLSLAALVKASESIED